MAEQAEIRARQAALAAAQDSAAGADRALAEVLAGAHAASTEGADRLNTIAAELAAADPAGFAADTCLGAREFQKFLIAKQRDIIAVVSEAHHRDTAGSQRVDALRGAYLPSGEH